MSTKLSSILAKHGYSRFAEQAKYLEGRNASLDAEAASLRERCRLLEDQARVVSDVVFHLQLGRHNIETAQRIVAAISRKDSET